MVTAHCENNHFIKHNSLSQGYTGGGGKITAAGVYPETAEAT